MAKDYMGMIDVVSGFRGQAEHCRKNDAPITGAIVTAQLELIKGTTKCGVRIANWKGAALEDALPLRLAGGLHHLHLSGREHRLAAIYTGEISDQRHIDQLVEQVVQDHDDELLPWLDGPPQTNEAGRSANYMATLIWLSARLGPRFELYEIGSSGGMNLLVNRYHYQLGDLSIGPVDSPVTIKPVWKGGALRPAPVEITHVRGCDIQPIDLNEDEAAERLRAYIWPDAPVRFERLNVGIAMIRQSPINLVKADAADWIEKQLTQPQQEGVTRVLMHSIVWQYIPADRRVIIENAMLQHAKKATAEKPLAWISLETNRTTFRHELRVRYWPGGAEETLLAESHAHGAWIDWRA